MITQRRPPFTAPLRLATVGLAVASLAASLAACGDSDESGRNALAYCKAFYTHGAPIRKGIEQINEQGVSSNPFGAIIKLVSAPNDLATVFDAMADHADDSIRSDTEAVRDSLKRSSDDIGKSVTNPFEGLVDGAANALASSGSWTRVDAYMNAHCPTPNSALAQKWIAQAGGDH